jgi:DNA polymerase-1
MLQYKWESVTITTNRQANEMLKLFEEIKPKVGAMDTETDGLHIIRSRPFLFQFGFLHPTKYKGYTFAVDIERQPKLAEAVIKAWHGLAETLELYFGHHITFDLHMMSNIGIPYTKENMSDTMFYIRYAHDALSEKNGGPPLGLKPYAARYIDFHAKDHDRLLQAERSQIAKELNLKLKLRLKNCGTPPAKYGAKSYTLSVIEAMFKDPIMDYHDLPTNVKEPYMDWLQMDVPIYLQPYVTGVIDSDMIPYNVLNRENVTRYAHHDIIYTLETWLKLAPVVEARENTTGIDMENKLIMPLYEMERVGFKADKQYIEDCRRKLKAYIIERRQKMFGLTGQEFTIGQHELVKTILNNDFQIPVSTTNSDELDLVLSELLRNNPEHPGIEFINILQELRTLEKWYSTYIMRFLKDLKFTDRLYTTIHQVATVSGRVASDFQQFPKDAIKTYDGQELFCPRKMITPTGGDYNAIVYLDYSQIELRFQAFYTILVGNPDLNLCRAYMPYKCINADNSIRFDYTNPDHILNWNTGWYLEESPKTLWEPTDVHAATTEAATGLTPGTKEFKDARSKIGKRVNFAKNYGAQRGKIRQMFPEKTEEEITRINNAYYTAFPGVKDYHDYCYARAQGYSYTENLFGIKYYGVSGHKLINILVQGSAAYYLKWKIRELYDYCKTNNIKSRWQMQIHDELSWERHFTELNVFFEFKRIMQEWPDTMVPIIAEMDATIATWADKKGVESLDELRLLIGD